MLLSYELLKERIIVFLSILLLLFFFHLTRNTLLPFEHFVLYIWTLPFLCSDIIRSPKSVLFTDTPLKSSVMLNPICNPLSLFYLTCTLISLRHRIHFPLPNTGNAPHTLSGTIKDSATYTHTYQRWWSLELIYLRQFKPFYLSLSLLIVSYADDSV